MNYQDYLKEIIKSEGSSDYRHSYVERDGKRVDVLENGWYACAFYVCSILKKFNLIWRVHRTVGVTVKDMLLHGWRSTKKLSPGDVIVWGKRPSSRNPQGIHLHIGFYLGEDKAICNIAENAAPTVIHYTYGIDENGLPKRKIIKILTHRFVRRGIKAVNETAWLRVEGDKLFLEYIDVLGKPQLKSFNVVGRKEDFDEKRAKLYRKDKYWAGGPMPPGEYYLYFRDKNDEKGNRLQLSQKKPKKLIEKEHYVFGFNILNPLKRQEVLKFKNSADRSGIQIHGHKGRASRGCIIISEKDEKTLYQIVRWLFERGIGVKVKIDDYWQTKEGKEEGRLRFGILQS